MVGPDSVADDLGWKPISGGSWATGSSSAYFASCDRNLTMPFDGMSVFHRLPSHLFLEVLLDLDNLNVGIGSNARYEMSGPAAQ